MSAGFSLMGQRWRLPARNPLGEDSKSLDETCTVEKNSSIFLAPPLQLIFQKAENQLFANRGGNRPKFFEYHPGKIIRVGKTSFSIFFSGCKKLFAAKTAISNPHSAK
jgi:hypothetical protein